MKDTIKFIHCSDIHLGSNPYGIDERFEDMGKAFAQVVDCAIGNMVDFMVIAGDFFHKRALDARTLEQAVNLLEPLKKHKIPVYMTEGNHDMSTYTTIYSWLDFLNSKDYIHLLKPTFITETKLSLDYFDAKLKKGGIIETDDYIIIGLGYPGATASVFINKLVNMYPDNKEKVLVTMLHTGIDKFVTEGMGGLRENEIEEIVQKSDYIALGHIHRRYENAEKKYYNPGSIENVKLESGIKNSDMFNKGFYLVNINKKSREATTEFINTEVRNSKNIDIDLSTCADAVEAAKYVVEHLYKSIEDNDKGIVLQIKLIGSLKNGSTIIDTQEIKKEIKKNLNVIYVEVLNMLSNDNEKEINIENLKSREDIDKEVITELIKDEGFGEGEVEKLLYIIMQMKEVAKDGQLTLEKKEGQDIKKLIESMLVDVNGC